MSAPPPPSELAALVALAALPGIGPAAVRSWLDAGTAVRAWKVVSGGHPKADPVLGEAIARQRTDEATMVAAASRAHPERFLRLHRDLGIAVLVRGHAGYPSRLDDDPSPPGLLFVDGSLDGLDGPAVAIVGTRNATRLGCDTAGALALELARAGVAVVSGLALGIDGAAHAGVVAELERSSSTPHGVGRPVAVVAAGLDRRYPRAHASLHDRIARTGAVVSEVPLGVAPSRWRFPARNRIIAGLADALVVVESRSAGGSMLTVGDALARDVPVLAVPGHPTSPAAAGTLDLICDGATPVRDAQDVLVAIGRGGLGPDGGGAQRSGGGRSTIDGVTWGEEVLGELASGPRTFTELTAKIDAPMDDLAEALLRLEVLGLLTRTGTWYQEAVASPARAGARSR